jgi:nicotinamide riboside transporter PnuC
MLLLIANILAPLMGCIGILALSYKLKIGFIVFFVVELCFFYIGYESSQWGICMMAIIYFFFNIFGYCKWRAEEISNSEKSNSL